MQKPDFSNLKIREPVITNAQAKEMNWKKANKEWLLITESIKREIPKSPSLREKLKTFLSIPVSEEMPRLFLQQVEAVNTRTQKLKKRFRGNIVKVLQLDTVPDEAIYPDIKSAPNLAKPNLNWDMRSGWYTEKDYSKEEIEKEHRRIEEHIRKKGSEGEFVNALTGNEKSLILKRYKMARDVKLLALMAELHDNPQKTQKGQQDIKLPSGTEITITTESDQEKKDLLDIKNWKKRKQIKDRVYEISIGERTYILKERKTARHKDTMKGGHFDGLTSQQEYETAKFLQEHATEEKNGIRTVWEKPVGYIEYPDGFQAALFQHHTALAKGNNKTIQEELQEALSKDEETEKQRATVEAKAQQLLKTHKELTEYSSIRQRLNLLFRNQKLTKKAFAQVKAMFMIARAPRMQSDILRINGLHNRDGISQGSIYQIQIQEKTVLEIVGYDYEYMQKIQRVEEKDLVRKWDERLREWERSSIIRDSDLSLMQKAAYLALLEEDEDAKDQQKKIA
jgi:hypothetical protein